MSCCSFDIGFWGSIPVRRYFFWHFFLFQCKNMYDHRWWLKRRKSSREVCLLIYRAAGAAAVAVLLLLFFFSFSYVDTVHGLITAYLHLIDYVTILYAAARRTGMDSYIPACCFVVWCYNAVAAAAAAVRHREPDGKNCFRGLLPLIPVFSLSSFEHEFISMCSLVVLSFLEPIFLPTIHTIRRPYCGHARSQGGR